MRRKRAASFWPVAATPKPSFEGFKTFTSSIESRRVVAGSPSYFRR
ncbi:hypothetical protein SAMN04487926_104252 [Paraburkholderia steynii]|uniref:Uncharacterized protein n=1 Tax=Paraburkholderia steynii TaxID=1245441 RepID=A0A7Z7B3E7_9BURK|nr:hypothetical protein SAMN04487926_104252 [Paraburkholderia steynii]